MSSRPYGDYLPPSNELRQPIYEEFPARHPSVMNLLKWLEPNPRLKDEQWRVAMAIVTTAKQMLILIPQDGPELTAGLRYLLQSKDSLVRASLDSEPVDYRDR